MALAAPLSPVELEHRAGAAEWAGGALSLGTGLALLAVWWRRAEARMKPGRGRLGVLAGWALLGDPLSANLGAAAVLIAVGIYLVNR